MSKIEINIEGMTCGHCAMSVTNELVTLEGVSNVQVDHAAGKATVEVEGVSEDQLSAAVEEAGYQVTSFATIDG
jgi:copper chaperone CopZ